MKTNLPPNARHLLILGECRITIERNSRMESRHIGIWPFMTTQRRWTHDELILHVTFETGYPGIPRKGDAVMLFENRDYGLIATIGDIVWVQDGDTGWFVANRPDMQDHCGFYAGRMVRLIKEAGGKITDAWFHKDYIAEGWSR